MRELDSAELKSRSELVGSDWQGIFAPYEAFYIHSILYSAGRATEAFRRFDVARSLTDTAATQVSAIHEALSHAAALSRYFWPSGGGAKHMKALRDARGGKLRQAFDLTDGSPLRDRNLRDALEHFDERLDSHLLTLDSGNFFPAAMVGDAASAGDPTSHFFKLVDPAAGLFVLLSDTFEFRPIRAEVESVYERAAAMDADGSRLTRRK